MLQLTHNLEGDALRKSYFTVSLVLLLSIPVALSTVSDECRATTWAFSIVDFTSWHGMDTSLVLDSRGFAQVSYTDTLNHDLKYANWTGAGWNIQTVDSVGYVGNHSSLVLDALDYPHISYFDDTNDDLKHAYWTGFTWAIETVDFVGSVGKYTSIDLDGLGHPHISYSDSTTYDLKYANWTGANWDIQTVDSSGSVGNSTSLALNSRNHPCIIYIDDTNRKLKYAEWNGSVWTIEVVDQTYWVGQSISLAMDGNDDPHLSYGRARSLLDVDLKYAKRAGTWQNQTVDDDFSAGTYSSLALDTSGNPHIAYYYDQYMVPKYAVYTQMGWVFEIVDESARDGKHISIALDANDNPQMSYIGFDQGHLIVARALVHAPSPPVNLLATAGDGQVDLQWSAPWDDGGSAITNYRIYRGQTPATKMLLTTLGNILTYTDSSVINGQGYYYEVSAVTASGEGPPSNEAYAYPAGPPGSPANLIATPGEGFVTLEWEAPSDTGGFPIVGYHIYRGSSPGEETPLVRVGNILSFTDTIVIGGETYYYSVSAVNSRGEGRMSNEASAIPASIPEDREGDGRILVEPWLLVLLAAIIVVLIVAILLLLVRKSGQS